LPSSSWLTAALAVAASQRAESEVSHLIFQMVAGEKVLDQGKGTKEGEGEWKVGRVSKKRQKKIIVWTCVGANGLV
jgi:hypothetical protein